MTNAIEIRGLSKHYAGFSLNNVNLTLPGGCIMGLIGENGAGKTTTLKLALELMPRDGGEVRIWGHSRLTRDARERLGVVLDECSFPESLSLRDIAAVMKRCYRTWQPEAFARYAAMFRLPDKKPVKEYSRGMKMKLSIAVALSHDSRLLILDEATSGLDPVVRDEILDVFLGFIKDDEHAILLSSHIVSDLEKVCDYVTLLHQGKVVFSRQKDALLDEFVVAKCANDAVSTLPSGAVVGIRRNSFGAEALVRRSSLPRGMAFDPATLEDIMLYHVKEGHAQ